MIFRRKVYLVFAYDDSERFSYPLDIVDNPRVAKQRAYDLVAADRYYACMVHEREINHKYTEIGSEMYAVCRDIRLGEKRP